MPSGSPREGFRVIMPDLRAHGLSGKPHDAASIIRSGILVRDLDELIAHLGLDEFDLGGFSLGARTIVEAVGEGLRPRRAILAGMGLEGLTELGAPPANSSSRRSTGSTPRSAATRTGWRSSS